MDIEKLSNLFGADLIKEIYKDSLSKPVKETSEILTDAVKAFRLFTAPIQLLASFQSRLQNHLETIRNRVPKENQIPCPPKLAGPIFEELRFLEDDNILTELYLNLLTRGIDSGRVAEAHPAFLIIIQQLSTDEARILYNLKDSEYVFLECGGSGGYNIARTIENNKPILEGLHFPEQIAFYLNHLNSLNILTSQTTYAKDKSAKEDPVAYMNKFTINKTDFGEAFIKAVIPVNLKF